jgi:AcrR family transcriptional regulator
LPYPPQVTEAGIINQAWHIIDNEGVSNFSLSNLAAALGIKAPSLYRHVGSKGKLLRAVNLLTLQKLFAALDEALEDDTAVATTQLLAIFAAYRTFALTHPHVYVLAFEHRDDQRPDEGTLVQMVLPLQTLMAQLCGETNSLTALRGALALIHGFVMLEINQQLRRGGDLAAAFMQSSAAYLKGWQQSI